MVENIPEKRKVLYIVLVNIQINRAENMKAETVTMEGFQFISLTRQKVNTPNSKYEPKIASQKIEVFVMIFLR